jgi:ketosteroid isomerase-like protein
MMTNKDRLEHIYTEISHRNAVPLLDGLADDAVWTIIGTTVLSGVYRGKQEITQGLLKRLTDRLDGGVAFEIVTLIAENDHVVLVANGTATARNGRPYNNKYCIVARFGPDGKIHEMTDYIDTELVTAALT